MKPKINEYFGWIILKRLSFYFTLFVRSFALSSFKKIYCLRSRILEHSTLQPESTHDIISNLDQISLVIKMKKKMWFFSFSLPSPSNAIVKGFAIILMVKSAMSWSTALKNSSDGFLQIWTRLERSPGYNRFRGGMCIYVPLS